MNNWLSYCGLIDAKMRPSDKDLPVRKYIQKSIKVPLQNYRLRLLRHQSQGILKNRFYSFLDFTFTFHIS